MGHTAPKSSSNLAAPGDHASKKSRLVSASAEFAADDTRSNHGVDPPLPRKQRQECSWFHRSCNLSSRQIGQLYCPRKTCGQSEDLRHRLEGEGAARGNTFSTEPGMQPKKNFGGPRTGNNITPNPFSSSKVFVFLMAILLFKRSETRYRVSPSLKYASAHTVGTRRNSLDSGVTRGRATCDKCLKVGRAALSAGVRLRQA